MEVHGFNSESVARRLRRFADEELINIKRKGSTTLPQRGNVVLRAYVVVPVEEIPSARKEYDEGLSAWTIKPGSGEAVLYRLRDSGEEGSESEEGELTFIAQTDTNGDEVLQTIYNFGPQSVGADRPDSSTDQLCSDPVVFVTQEALSGRFVIVEDWRGLACDSSSGSGDGNCLEVITEIDFDEDECRWLISRKRICLPPGSTIEDLGSE